MDHHAALPAARRTTRAHALAMTAALGATLGALGVVAAPASASTLLTPDTLATTDVQGWDKDSFVLPLSVTTGVDWTYQVGFDRPVLVKAGTSDVTIRPFAQAKEQPAYGRVVVTASVSPGSGDVLALGARTRYELNFSVVAPVEPTAPVAGTDAKSGFTTIAVPNVKNLAWELTTYAADGRGAVQVSGMQTVSFFLPPGKDGKPVTPPKELVFGAAERPFQANTVKVRLTAKPASSYTLLDLSKPVTGVFVFPVKARVTAVDQPTADKVVAVDNPGTANDHVLVTGLEGVDWQVSGKSLGAKPGESVKVSPVKGLPSITVIGMAAPGYTWRSLPGKMPIGSVTYLRTFVGDITRTVTPTFVGQTATLTADPAVKSWSWSPDGSSKSATITFPAGASQVQVVIPSTGVLTATPNMGYAVTSDTGVSGKSGSWRWPLVR